MPWSATCLLHSINRPYTKRARCNQTLLAQRGVINEHIQEPIGGTCVRIACEQGISLRHGTDEASLLQSYNEMRERAIFVLTGGSNNAQCGSLWSYDGNVSDGHSTSSTRVNDFGDHETIPKQLQDYYDPVMEVRLLQGTARRSLRRETRATHAEGAPLGTRLHLGPE